MFIVRDTFTIREAVPADAPGIIEHIKQVISEPESNIPMLPHEFTHTIADEEQMLRKFAQRVNSVFLVAEAGGKIIGQLNCRGFDEQMLCHTTILSMSVQKEWRNRNVGQSLLEYAIVWATRTKTIKRIELTVYERNAEAIHIYQKFGFVIEGKRRCFVYRDGGYLNDLLMSLLL